MTSLHKSATWRSGYAADCKSVHTGSIPVVASTIQINFAGSNSEVDQPSLRVARASDDMSRREVASAFPLLDLDRGVVDAEPARQSFDRLAEERVIEPNARPHEMRRQGGL